MPEYDLNDQICLKWSHRFHRYPWLLCVLMHLLVWCCFLKWDKEEGVRSCISSRLGVPRFQPCVSGEPDNAHRVPEPQGWLRKSKQARMKLIPQPHLCATSLCPKASPDNCAPLFHACEVWLAILYPVLQGLSVCLSVVKRKDKGWRADLGAKKTPILNALHIQNAHFWTVASEMAACVCACRKSKVCLVMLRPVQNGTVFCLRKVTSSLPRPKAITLLTL